VVDQIAVVTVTTPNVAAPTTIDVTSPLITETFSAAILIYSGFTADNNDNSHGILGIGFVAPDAGATRTEEAMCAAAEDGNAIAPNCNTLHANNAAVNVPDPTSATAAAGLVATYNSSIAGGVRLNLTTIASIGGGNFLQVKITAILFAGLSRAYVDDTAANTTAHEDVGGTTDFQPDLAVFAATGGGLTAGQQDGIPNMGFACNKAGVPQVHAYVRLNDAVEPTDGDGFVSSAHCYGAYQNGTDNRERASITSFDATGWNQVAEANTPTAHYVGLKFSGAFRMQCDNFPVTASATPQDFAFGFTPDIVVGMVTLLTAEDSEVDGATASAAGFFVTGRFGSRAYTLCHREGINIPADANSFAKSRQEDVAVLCYDHQGNVVIRGVLVGPSGNAGLRINFTTASQAAMLTMLGIQLHQEAPSKRGNAVRAVAQPSPQHRHRPTVGGTRHSSVIGRVLAEVARFRRAALARVRWRPLPEGEPFVPPVAIVLEEPPKGRIAAPGLVRGRVVATGDTPAHVAQAGLLRGRLSGPTIKQPEDP